MSGDPLHRTGVAIGGRARNRVPTPGVGATSRPGAPQTPSRARPFAFFTDSDPMSDNEMIVAIASMVITFGTIIVIARTWLTRGRSRAPAAEIEPVMDRLLRIEQTLDSVAIEVERISEAQRFATRLLADRDATPALMDSHGIRDGR